MATKRDVREIVKDQALSDAKKIFKQGKTVGLTADNYRRTLKKTECDNSLPYFDRGRELYALYLKTLTTAVEQIYADHGMTIRYDVILWDGGRKRLSCPYCS